MASTNPLTDDHTGPDAFPVQRRLIVTPDGMKLARQYVYLAPDTWKALEALMAQRGHVNTSQAVSRLILDAANNIKPSQVKDGSKQQSR
jgi:hypothetical protein